MKELARIMRFDFLTAMGTPGTLMLMMLFTAVSILAGMFCFPLGSVYFEFTLAGALIAPLGRAAAKNGFNKLYGVLPVSRKNITRARFVYIFLVAFAAEVTTFLLTEISYAAKLYRLLPVTAPDIKAMLEQNFDKTQSYSLTVKVLVAAFIAITVLSAVFSMLSMIFGSENKGKIIAISVAILLFVSMGFVMLNEMDILPVFNFMGFFMKDISAAGIIICNISGAAVCLVCGEVTANRLALREL